MEKSRRDIIRAMLAERPFLSLKELTERFPEFSGMTLRRDIEYLAAQGECVKVRGGAQSMKFITASAEDAYTLRLNANSEEKEAVARCAAGLITPGMSVFLDSGTTALKTAFAIGDLRVTVTTSGPNVALELLRSPLPIVHTVGGRINRGNLSVSGTQALRYLEDTAPDLAFLSPAGLTAERGFSCGNYSECEFRREVIRRARCVVLMMDGSKIGREFPYTFARMEDADILITSAPLPKELERAAAEAGTKIILAEPGT